jgi:hypothetical protein
VLTADTGARLAPYLFILLWSSSFVTARAGLAVVSPLLFVAVRLVAATVLLGAVLAVRRQSLAPLRGRWHRLALAGMLVNGVTLSASHVEGPAAWGAVQLGLVGAASLAGGTLYFGRFGRDVPLLPGTAVQLGAAAVLTVMLTIGLERPHAIWTFRRSPCSDGRCSVNASRDRPRWASRSPRPACSWWRAVGRGAATSGAGRHHRGRAELHADPQAGALTPRKPRPRRAARGWYDA